MRGDIVYRVLGQHAGREQDVPFGTYRTKAEAEQTIDRLRREERDGRNWAAQYHDRGFVICEILVATDFEIPPLPKPRDKFAVRCNEAKRNPGTWATTHVEVVRRSTSSPYLETICEYERDFVMYRTFEPFRQGARELALISHHYTRSAVLDLASGKVIAEEPDAGKDSFCPVGFYVPDWWDVHGTGCIPGHEHWTEDREWPTGAFGFVWGCQWGDDSSWKVQFLDLSRVQEGILHREERFGYVELCASGFANPCFDPDSVPPVNSAAPPFIRVYKSGSPTVTFSVPMQFGLDSGAPEEWHRTRIAAFD